MTSRHGAVAERAASGGDGAWVVLPTYNEADNLVGISAAILDALPGATLLGRYFASPAYVAASG